MTDETSDLADLATAISTLVDEVQQQRREAAEAHGAILDALRDVQEHAEKVEAVVAAAGPVLQGLADSPVARMLGGGGGGLGALTGAGGR